VFDTHYDDIGGVAVAGSDESTVETGGGGFVVGHHGVVTHVEDEA
jgi:hypothetical protein